MAFYELVIKESKEPFDYQEIFTAVMALMKKIEVSSTITTDKRTRNRSSGSYAIDLENYLRRSKTEAPNYDFKQGLFSLHPSNRAFDNNCFEKICQNIAAIANLGKGKKAIYF